MKNEVYILYSSKLKRFYIGYTTNFDVRLSFHEISEARKFTAKADDWIVYLRIACKTKEQGIQIEKHIKRMKSSLYISNLKKYPEMIEALLAKY